MQQADSLAGAGRFFEAGIAYDRVGFEEADSAARLSAVFGKVHCLKQQGRFAPAVQYLNGEVTNIYPDSVLLVLRHEQITCAYLAGQFENALSLLERLPYLHPDRPTETPLTRVVRILSLNELQRWPEAGAAYQQLLAQAGADTTKTPYRQLPRLKSEQKAERLSTFIPGGGQFYAGKPGEAILSILVQSAGLYFGVTNFLAGYYLSAWGVGAALFGSFHAGGIRRSQNLVKEYNSRQVRQFNETVKKEVLKQVDK
ncbi:hypothetical protein F5984_01350 [Rudanella paleaurantiibacter]|uniref:Tetratricopeptide repeat protein n=1 Tax=Rudanella paleaurantiibacter TaxID=2614655 RepID=A0A7J5U616_9BACT|nr:hypothetical protein F5984_01350 [Rudanella paleaurantiibacter]